MDDKSLGSLIVVVSVVIMVGYFVWAFAPFLGPAVTGWISSEMSEWAYRLPVILAVYGMLLIVLWIGYTMATTPPPIPLESPLEIEQEEVDSEERMLSARFDAMLRMTAIALSEIQQAFDDSENAKQNSERMTRLVLWHFYAISFRLEQAIPLETHCEHVEALLRNAPVDVFSWVNTLTELLHSYADISAKQNPQD